jgi:trigger factor
VKVTAVHLPERQVKLQIEVEDERLTEAVELAYKRLAPRVQIRGFRPGKAPRPLIEKQLGHHRLVDEARDILMPVVYKEAIDEQGIDPVAAPDVELVTEEPLVFTATVPLKPVTDLNDYKAIKLPLEKKPVTDEALEDAITDLRRRLGTVEPVERAAQKGDIIRGDLKAQVGDLVLFEQKDIEYRLTDESLAALPGLIDLIVGMSKGQTKEPTFQVPEDFADERFAGQPAVYNIAVHEVKEEKLADPDDAFAQQVGEGFESMEVLRNRIREDMQKVADDQATREFEGAVLDKMVETASIDYPAVMVDHEIEHILEEQANMDPRDPRAVELYLQRMSKSEEEIREEAREEATQRLRRSLVLSRFAEAENITVDDSDIDAELQTISASAGEQAEAILQLFNTESSRDSLRRTVLARKTFSRMVELSATDASTPAAESAPKRRRAAPRKVEEKAPAEATDSQENS